MAMFRFLSAVALAAAASATASTPPPPPLGPTVAIRVPEAMNSRDVAALTALFSPEIEIVSDGCVVGHGREDSLDWLKGQFALGLRVSVETATAGPSGIAFERLAGGGPLGACMPQGYWPRSRLVQYTSDAAGKLVRIDYRTSPLEPM